jgi:spore coat polysaccharide biosynthesis protein SpsF
MNGIHLMPNVFIFIQARSGSQRLPNKVTKIFTTNPDLTLLDHIYTRSRQVLPHENIVFLIPKNDKLLIEFLMDRNYNYFEGDENNVRKRYIDASNHYNAKYILRLTGDNPFIDIQHLQLLVEITQLQNFDIASFKDLPLGMGGEIFSVEALVKTPKNGILSHMEEHVTLHMKENPNDFKILKLKSLLDEDSNKAFPFLRLTVDESLDFETCREIYFNLKSNPNFGAKEIIELWKQIPELFLKNNSVEQIKFQLPTIPPSSNSKKILLLCSYSKEHGSGHYERCIVLFVLLQTFNLEITLSTNPELENSFDFYIIDYRDFKIPKNIPIEKCLLIDNYNYSLKEAHLFYTMPHPNLSIGEEIIPLFSNSLDFYSKTKKIETKSILVYTGNLQKTDIDCIELFIVKSFPKYKIIRIGGNPPENSNIEWHQRVGKNYFFELLSIVEIFISYFGQSMLESLYLNKKTYLYSISDYHSKLSIHIQNHFPVEYLGKINELTNITISSKNYHKDVNSFIPKDGYKKLTNRILGLINK